MVVFHDDPEKYNSPAALRRLEEEVRSRLKLLFEDPQALFERFGFPRFSCHHQYGRNHLLIHILNPLPPSDAVRKQKNLFPRIFLVQYCHKLINHPSGKLKFNVSGIFQSLNSLKIA